MAIEINPVVLDAVKTDLFAPEKVVSTRDLITTYNTFKVVYEFTIRDPQTGELLDLTDLDTATVYFKCSDGTEDEDTPTVTGSVLSGTTGAGSTTAAGTWSASAKLEFSDGSVLYTGERPVYKLANPYTTEVAKRAEKLHLIDTASDDVTLIARPRSYATGGIVDFTGITVGRLLIQTGGAGAATVLTGTIDTAAGTITFEIPSARLSSVGSIYTGVLSFAGATRYYTATKQELYQVTDRTA